VNIKRIAIIVGPLIAILTPLAYELADYPHVPFMLGIAIWMALWWMTECVPLAVTALLPLVAFPLTGIAPAKEVAPHYMTSIMFLFVGGFLIAQGMEKTGLHRRIALTILSKLHASPLQLMIGFAVVTAMLSMWISNTATTMLMVTIALAVLARLDKENAVQDMSVFASALLLMIAYSANIGGMGTPVGTVPNIVLLENMRIHAADKVPGFLQWMMIGVPVVIAGLIVLIVLLGRQVRAMQWSITIGQSLIQEKGSLGKMERGEACVAWVLGITALAWMTRQGIQTDTFTIPGWSSLLPYKGVDDGTVAITGALTLFLLPDRTGKPILDHQAFAQLPWGILILLGGGFALANGMTVSGLSEWIGNQLHILKSVPVLLMLLIIAFMMTFLTEITSNTAITQVMLPILAAVAIANNQDITLSMMVATLCASCAFMLPVATPPNAIVFGTQRIAMKTMMAKGIRMNLIMPVVIVAGVILLRSVLP